MQEVRATMGAGFDGEVDPGIEQRRGGGGEVGAEAASHAILRMVGDFPGQMGRLRAARLVGGFAVQHHSPEEAAQLAAYAIDLDWPMREVTRLVDALIAGRLLAQTPGPRPVLVLTRAGFRALEALDGLYGSTRLSTQAAAAPA